jgi:4-nitrophenyl phosphatase
MKKVLKISKQIYVLGMNGIREELTRLGLHVMEVNLNLMNENDHYHLKDITEAHSIVPNDQVGAVVFGFDIDINYTKLATAFTYLQSLDCHFIATNDDLTFPIGQRVYPGILLWINDKERVHYYQHWLLH